MTGIVKIWMNKNIYYEYKAERIAQVDGTAFNGCATGERKIIIFYPFSGSMENQRNY